jgi:hypothetical protein
MHLSFPTPIIVSRKERLITLTLPFQSLQLGGDIYRPVIVITDIKGNDTDRVTGNEEGILLLIIEHKGKDATEVLQEINAFLTIQGENHLTVAARLEVILSGKLPSDVLMVIYLPIDGKNLFPVRREQRLSS